MRCFISVVNSSYDRRLSAVVDSYESGTILLLLSAETVCEFFEVLFFACCGESLFSAIVLRELHCARSFARSLIRFVGCRSHRTRSRGIEASRFFAKGLQGGPPAELELAKKPACRAGWTTCSLVALTVLASFVPELSGFLVLCICFLGRYSAGTATGRFV